MAVVINLPQDIEEQLRNSHPDLNRHVIEGFVADAYRRGELTVSQVGNILGLDNRWNAEQFLSSRGVFPNYDNEDLEDDLALIERLPGES